MPDSTLAFLARLDALANEASDARLLGAGGALANEAEGIKALVAVARAAAGVSCCMGCGGDCGERPAMTTALAALDALAETMPA